MEDKKSIFMSMTFWGAIMMVTATIMGMAGFNFGDPNGWATDIVGLIGAGFSIYGRIRAVKKIS